MKVSTLIITFLLSYSCLYADEVAPNYQKIFEDKYQTKAERFQVIDISERTKALWCDFEMLGDKSWWAGLSVVEVDEQGAPIYWYDSQNLSLNAGIESVTFFEIGEVKFLSVVSCSHMGNGSLDIYAIENRSFRSVLSSRVMANLNVHFSPRIAKIEHRDLDGDGDLDLTIQANCIEGQIIDKSSMVVGGYRRVYHYENGSFVEQLGRRLGHEDLMD